jgi:hypothetical protein
MPVNFSHHIPQKTLNRLESKYSKNLQNTTPNNDEILKAKSTEFIEDSRTVTKNSAGTFSANYPDGSYEIYDGKSFKESYNRFGQLNWEWRKENDGETFTKYEYADNGNKKVTVSDMITHESTTTTCDKDGNFLEKYTQKGAVTTYYDADNNPIKREINKGQGIVETENLSE